MKFNIIGDLHIEFGEFRHTPPDSCDAVIIAGDISAGYTKSDLWVKKNYKNCGKNIHFVSGNHEFYDGVDIKNIDVFGGCFEYPDENILIIASTLWTDFKYNNNSSISKIIAKKQMNDFRSIKYKGKKLTPDDSVYFFNKCFEYINSMIEANKDKNIVVVTHHAPCGMSISDKHKESDLNPAYVTDLSGFILKNNHIKAWIHGHSHSSCDYMLGETRVVNNPRGYANKNENPEFNQNKIIEIKGK